MAMGRRAKQRQQQADFWIAHMELPRTVAHPFYEQLNQLLEERRFDEFVEGQCERFYAEAMGRPSLTPGRYFRLLLIGYFEGSSTLLVKDVHSYLRPSRAAGPDQAAYNT